MKIVVNGEPREVDAATLAEALAALEYRRGDGRDRPQRRVRASAGARRDASQGWRPDRDPRSAAGGMRCGSIASRT